MAITRDQFLERLETTQVSVKVVGAQGGLFHIVCDADTIAGKSGPLAYPSLNHAADWLQRNGVSTFVVDVTNWRERDTLRSQGAARP